MLTKYLELITVETVIYRKKHGCKKCNSILDRSEEKSEMDKLKYRKTKEGVLYPSIPHKPVPKGRDESTDYLYHIGVMMVVGILLCLLMGVLDHVWQDTTPTTDTSGEMEYFE